MYPLSSCSTCLHKNVCKLIDIYNRIQEETPIDLSLATCHEHIHAEGEDVDSHIEKMFESAKAKKSEKVDTAMVDATTPSMKTLVQAIQMLVNKGLTVLCVSMNDTTFEDTFNGAYYNVMMFGDHTIEIEVDESVPDNMWDFDYTEGESDGNS